MNQNCKIKGTSDNRVYLLRAFGTSPKSSLMAGLQIHSERYTKDCALKGDDEYGEQRKSKRIYAKGD